MIFPKRFLKFCTVGFSGVIVNLGILYLLKEIFGLFYLASAIAIEISIITNFVLNDIYTFSDRRKAGRKNYFHRLLKWNLTRFLTLAINFIAFIVFTEIGFNYLLSQAIGIFIATLLAYLVSLTWVWK
jgi:dolichol-phosphate mannosyltransferase